MKTLHGWYLVWFQWEAFWACWSPGPLGPGFLRLWSQTFPAQALWPREPAMAERPLTFLTLCFFTSFSSPGFCPQQPDPLSAGHKLLTGLCHSRLTFSSMLLTNRRDSFAWCYNSVCTLSVCSGKICFWPLASNFSDIHGFFSGIIRLTGTRCISLVPISTDHSDLHLFLLHPQGSPSFFFWESWIFLTIHEAGTKSPSAFPALSNETGRTKTGASTWQAGWGGPSEHWPFCAWRSAG